MTYKIATAKDRTVKYWRNEEVTWEELKERLTTYVRTSETAEQYKLLSNKERGDIKDVGGFVGGALGGSLERTKKNIKCRSLITIDIDKAQKLPDLSAIKGCRYILYSTHSYTPEKPCVRIVVPLDREVTPLEYRAITHHLCAEIGLDGIDMSCCEPERLMFYPSVPADVYPLTVVEEGEPLKADEILGKYNNWQDPREWVGAKDSELRHYALPQSTVQTKGEAPTLEQRSIQIGTVGRLVEDPLLKCNIVGAWCRAVSIYEALEKYCWHLYVPTNDKKRYTFVNSESEAGVIVYDDRWIYSNHTNKDPLAGQLLNSFDLVRLTKFGDKDKGSRTTDPQRMPSYLAMAEFAMTLPEVRGLMTQIQFEEANRAFGLEVVDNTPVEEKGEDDGEKKTDDWMVQLDDCRDVKTGQIRPSVLAFSIILMNDVRLIRNQVKMDEFSGLIVVTGELRWDRGESTMWTDSDMASLELEVQKLWNVENKSRALKTAFLAVFGSPVFRYNPVREFITSAKWDGKKRVETLFRDYLGVPDTPLFRTIARKTIVACVARAMDPGCKYDQITILAGEQGQGKSTIIYKLAGEGRWSNDSLDLGATNNKLEEAVVGSWIVEIPDLQGYQKKEVDSLKGFISKRQDKFRAAYREFTQVHPRTCVFFGTTNEEQILRDKTGNRRFWILPCVKEPTEDVWSINEDLVTQVWAEALEIYNRGEALFLDKQMSEELKKMQKDFDLNQSELEELRAWLDKPIPTKRIWDDLTKEERRLYFTDPSRLDYFRIGGSDPLEQRDTVCAMEVLTEFYGEGESRFRAVRCRDINQMLAQLNGWKRGVGQMTVKGYGRQVYFERVGVKAKIVNGREEVADEWEPSL